MISKGTRGLAYALVAIGVVLMAPGMLAALAGVQLLDMTDAVR